LKLLDVEERPATVDDLQAASEAFIASTTREVQAVGMIEQQDLHWPGEVTQQAAAALRRRIEEELQAVRA
jgi:branched-subunit amino acid aminotransferase/4-amino-4-deoxychorismate lyase